MAGFKAWALSYSVLLSGWITQTPRFLLVTSGSGDVAGGPGSLGSRISFACVCVCGGGAELSSIGRAELKEIHQNFVEDPTVTCAGSCFRGDGRKGQDF